MPPLLSLYYILFIIDDAHAIGKKNQRSTAWIISLAVVPSMQTMRFSHFPLPQHGEQSVL
jgi:hypothetical protein